MHAQGARYGHGGVVQIGGTKHIGLAQFAKAAGIKTEAGVPSGEILSIDEVFTHPQVKHLGLAAPMESAARGRMQVVAQPVKLERTPSRIARASPERGEHSNEVLAELGFSGDEISALREQSIV